MAQNDLIKSVIDPQQTLSTLQLYLYTRVRQIPCRRPIPDTIGRSYTDTNTDTDTGLYNFLYWKCDFVRGIDVCRLYMSAGYMRKNMV